MTSWAVWIASFYDIIASQRSITSWRYIHGDGCLQTPIISDYQFNFTCNEWQKGVKTRQRGIISGKQFQTLFTFSYHTRTQIITLSKTHEVFNAIFHDMSSPKCWPLSQGKDGLHVKILSSLKLKTQIYTENNLFHTKSAMLTDPDWRKKILSFEIKFQM